MSRGTAYYDLPNGERIELPTTMPDVEEVPGPLCDGKFELPEAVKEMFKWMDETFGTWESDFSSFKIWMKLRKNFNPPVRWEAMQDKRRNPKPLLWNCWAMCRESNCLPASTQPDGMRGEMNLSNWRKSMEGLVKTLGILMALAAVALWAALIFFVPAALIKFLWLYLVA